MTAQTTVPELAEPRDFVDGRQTAPARRLDAWLADPNTAGRLQRQVATAPEEVDRAVELAAGNAWPELGDVDRIAWLERIATATENVTADIAVVDAVNTGVPHAVTTLLAGSIPGVFRAAAARLRAAGTVTDLSDGGRTVRLHRLPWGPAAVLAPWNAPTVVAAKKMAYALAAGCPVVGKPSPWAPTGTTLLTAAVTDTLADDGLLSGTVQLVHGDADVGAYLAGDARIRALALTGSRPTGRAVAHAAAGDLKALQLELGSNNPAIVLPDADVAATADALVAGITKLNGQWCEAPGSVFVPPSLHDALVDALLDRLAPLRLGHCLADDTDIGPQANHRQYTRLTGELRRLSQHGARLLTSTSLPDLPGWFLAPTVVCDADPADTREELFGPVLTVHVATDPETALRLANQCTLGLAGYVFGTDHDAALRLSTRVAAGEVKVNGTSILDLADDSAQAFWGTSGIGGHGDAALLEFFRGARMTGVDLTNTPL